MEFSQVENEVIGLRAVVGSLDSMVNHEMLRLAGADRDTEVSFGSPTHRQLFNVLLVDFLEPVDSSLTGVNGSCLDVLQQVCRMPIFDDEGSVEFLSIPVNTLQDWLETDVVVESWLPSIDTNVQLQIRRSEFVYICGNISKHNFARLTRTSKKLAAILVRNGVAVGIGDALDVLDEFYERFHSDIFAYHCTAMAELLNNVRWGIHEYLWAEFLRSYTRDPSDSIKYSHRYPIGVERPFAKTCYWELMNDVRRKPFVARFEATKLLKLRY